LSNKVAILENLAKQENLLSNNVQNEVAIFSELPSKPSARASHIALPRVAACSLSCNLIRRRTLCLAWWPADGTAKILCLIYLIMKMTCMVKCRWETSVIGHQIIRQVSFSCKLSLKAVQRFITLERKQIVPESRTMCARRKKRVRREGEPVVCGSTFINLPSKNDKLLERVNFFICHIFL
jgi:hypothetical protein